MNNQPSNLDQRNPVSRRRVLKEIAAVPFVAAAANWLPISSAQAKVQAPNKYDAIVVGAGAIGCSTAWHLAKRGQKVLVLEAHSDAAMQSTNGAGGFVASWSQIHIAAWQKTEWEMQRYGIEFYTRLAGRSRADLGFSPSGIAYVYASPKDLRKGLERVRAGRKLGTTIEVLSKERSEEIAPFLQFDQVAGIAFDPDAVRVRAGDAIRALAHELAGGGVKFEFDTQVSGFLREGDKIAGVRAWDQNFYSERVFVTAGAWSRPLLGTLGAACPSTPFNETRYVTKPLEGLPPGMLLLIFADRHGHYIREERGGLLIGGGDKRPLPADRAVSADSPPWCDKLPDGQAYRIREFIREIERIMPVLKNAEVDQIRSGIPTLTTGNVFIAGPVPEVQGMFVASGCQEAGVTHGPALGRILCEHAMDGKTVWDTTRFLPQSFTS